VHGEDGQATVEWVALVLTAALVLGAGAALAGREADRGLGEKVAERISRTATRAAPSPEAAAPPPERAAPPPAGAAPMPARAAPPPAGAAPMPARAAPPPTGAAPPPTRAASPSTRSAPPPVSGPPAVQAFRRLRGVADVARHTWIVCLGYRRWRYELDHPMAPTESLPLDEALGIANSCLNPYDYLVED
jgi:hypothetical protein